MRFIKLIAPTALIATIALFAPHADAQTMGEYATTTASAANGAGGLGTSIGSVVNSVNSDTSGDIGGGSRTWGASSLGASFDERAGAASGSGAGQDFESRAGSSGSGLGSDSRWPTRSQDSANDRFADTTRFQDEDRFPERTSASENRFPSGVFDQNRQGLDTHYSSSSGLDGGYSTSGGLDNSYSSN
jgi:hypothetical protein